MHAKYVLYLFWFKDMAKGKGCTTVRITVTDSPPTNDSREKAGGGALKEV